MQSGTHNCEAAVDAVCPADTALSVTGSIIGIGAPVVMLGLGFWLTSRFWYQLNTGAGSAATGTILGGYVVLFLIGVMSAIIASTTATNWGVLMISLTLPFFIIVFVYTPVWLLTLLVFFATRKIPD